MGLVLVDTSIWIPFFKNGRFKDQIKHSSNDSVLATCGVIKAELFPFVQNNYSDLNAYFNTIQYLPFEDSWWPELIQIRTLLLKKGETCTLPDLMIAMICLKNHCHLFTQDKDFYRMSDLIGLRLYLPH